MRRVALVIGAVLLAGCAKKEAPPPAEVPAPPSIDLAALAGTWATQTTAEGSDSVLVSGTITANCHPAGGRSALGGTLCR
jgi:coenzyme F420-reducing hydrogenase delta subunit